jgi:hypothetical protein
MVMGCAIGSIRCIAISDNGSPLKTFNYCRHRRQRRKFQFVITVLVLQIEDYFLICLQRLVCPEVSAPSGGFGYYSANPPPRHPGNVYIQSCIRSYVGRGPAERLCQNDGSWSGSPLSCHRSEFDLFSCMTILQ